MQSTLRTFNNITPAENIEREKVSIDGMTDISRTLFLPLFFRAKETEEGGLIADNKAVSIIKSLNYSNKNFLVDREMQLIMTLRTLVLDQIVRQYINTMQAQGQQPVVINLGAGLDTREYRFPEARWYEVDLDAPIQLRQQYLPDSRATNIIGSIFEQGWNNAISEHQQVLIIVEGVLMYFNKEMVHTFFQIVADTFTNSQIAFDTLAPRYSTLKNHQSIDVDLAPFLCGVSNSTDVENFNLGFQTEKEYSYWQTYMDYSNLLQERYRLLRFDATHKIYLMNIK